MTPSLHSHTAYYLSLSTIHAAIPACCFLSDIHFLLNFDALARRFNPALMRLWIEYVERQKEEPAMTLVILGLLLGLVGIVWVMVLEIVLADGQRPRAEKTP